MSLSSIESLKIKAKLLQKSKRKKGIEIALKDAYTILAKSHGHKSWKELKDIYEVSDLLNPPKWSAIWKVWFSNYLEASEYLKTHRGFLLPFRNHFFICDIYYINALGILADDDDLKLVGNDWSIPKNKAAYMRLLQKIKRNNGCQL